MTSFAFILGVFPLLVGRGAGAEMRRTLGTAVFSGMLGVTIFGIFLTPVFFSVIDWLGGRRLFHTADGSPADSRSCSRGCGLPRWLPVLDRWSARPSCFYLVGPFAARNGAS